MAEPYVDAVEWAGTVDPAAPHGLVDVEDVLLSPSPANIQRLTWHDRFSGVRVVGLLVFLIAAVAPAFGPGAFMEHVWRRPGYTLDVQLAFRMAAVAFCIGMVFQLGFLVTWWRAGRKRDGAVLGWSIAYAVCGVITLLRARGHVGEFDGNATAYLVPVWITLALSALTIVLVAISAPDPMKRRIRTARLSDDSRALLLAERAAALRTLAERDLLDPTQVEALSARPLGELHRTKEATR